MASYIYNKVLIPRIEYKLQTTFLTPNMLKNIQKIINKTIKHKFNIEKTLPQNWFFNPQIFNIKSISDYHNEVLISNLQYSLTNPTTKNHKLTEILSLQKMNIQPLFLFQNPFKLFIHNSNSISTQISNIFL